MISDGIRKLNMGHIIKTNGGNTQGRSVQFTGATA